LFLSNPPQSNPTSCCINAHRCPFNPPFPKLEGIFSIYWSECQDNSWPVTVKNTLKAQAICRPIAGWNAAHPEIPTCSANQMDHKDFDKHVSSVTNISGY